ncbi:MAG: hypothetical protein Ta2B_04310 [Termitinemataceae bacterium]|nr:MAG: hypothetical protein Ta2B_04310 [Termitinemataceae bacterium]
MIINKVLKKTIVLFSRGKHLKTEVFRCALYIIAANILFACKDFALNDFEKQISKSPNALEYLINELKTKDKRILFICENHTVVNEEIFLTNNIQKFYDAGVRYIFLESRIPDFALPGNKNYFFYMFYPWTSAGWRYEQIAYFQTILDMCNKKNDPLIMIVPEEGREEVENSGTTANKAFINYRDSFATERIIEILDGDPQSKAIILYGSNHGIKRVIKPDDRHWDYDFERKPMKYLLSEHFGSKIDSYIFFFNNDFLSERKIKNRWKESIEENTNQRILQTGHL